MGRTSPTPTERPVATRDGFTSSFGVLAATLGSAVGLGNIWKFPYLTGTNGGAGFLVVYLLATLLVGLPVMIAEIMLGRKAKADPVTAMRELAPKGQPWWLVSAAGVLAAFLIMAFYSEVAAWVFAYVFKAIDGAILSSDPKVTTAAFKALVGDPVQSLLWQWLVLLLIGGILLMGVAKGIEAVTKKLMPLLFVLLLVICVRSLMLPGASQGLAFLFAPDFSKINASVLLVAMGLAFFKLSIGMGTMMTYGSYFRDDQNIPATTLRVMGADLFVSMLAGIAIFPAVFAFGFEPAAGPSLVFITIPAVFASMPFGHLFMIVFFVLTSIAAIGAMLSILEVPVAVVSGRFGLSRKLATLLNLVVLAAVGATCALSSSLLANVKVLGRTFFDLFDFLSSSLLMPVGGIVLCIFVGWVWGYDRLRDTLSNGGVLHNEGVLRVLFFVIRFISPVLILVVMLNGLGVF
ncbi:MULTISPECIES: sodium-dependent transporter [Gulbenkiania]|uniref:Transporter n=2 Tax=Gulbenkiania TaxID=397456 RepID=A0A0K6H133_9NEIS|nr:MULTISPECIES: sodium-dependent transporter [Gulbenkiania]TCW31389.1 NSS family neurotransmitter:Na+ symporter [Gulbenkiania mobilis]CUA84575.1 Na+-dependent transporter, SNF family [Gulbenkiania indica]